MLLVKNKATHVGL